MLSLLWDMVLKEEKIIGWSKILGDLVLERMVFSESREELVIVVLDGNSIMLDCVPKKLTFQKCFLKITIFYSIAREKYKIFSSRFFNIV